ncbi:MAG: hypothetical protein ABMA64_28080 [Myxococcota bacterium]
MTWWIAIAQASTVDIEIADPAVTEVILDCVDGVYRSPVRSGVASFDRMPQGCKVSMIRRSGTIDRAGKWACNLDKCEQQDVLHLPVTDAPGRVNVILTTELPKGTMLEVTCTGYRQRADVTQNTAVFDGVPSGTDCELYFKGAVPTRFRPIGPGTWTCSMSGSAAICTGT